MYVPKGEEGYFSTWRGHGTHELSSLGYLSHSCGYLSQPRWFIHTSLLRSHLWLPVSQLWLPVSHLWLQVKQLQLIAQDQVSKTSQQFRRQH